MANADDSDEMGAQTLVQGVAAVVKHGKPYVGKQYLAARRFRGRAVV